MLYFRLLILTFYPLCYRKMLTTNDAMDVKILTAENHNVVEEPIAEFCAFTLFGST